MKNSQQVRKKGTSRSSQYYGKHKNDQNKKKQTHNKAGTSKRKTAKSVKFKCKKGEECICTGKSEQSKEKVTLPNGAKTEKIVRYSCHKDKVKSELFLEKGKECVTGPTKNVPKISVHSSSHLHAAHKPSSMKKEKKGVITPGTRTSLPLYKAVLSKQNISKWKMYKYGERGTGIRTITDELQDYELLLDECLKKDILFEDPEFPAADSSLYFEHKPSRPYVWKRPKELVYAPQFFIEDFSRFDIIQGELGDCWILAAAANLTLYKNLFYQVVPQNQSFDEKYAGIFRFRLWKYGRWIEVVIDDRLPTRNGRLAFVHSSSTREFWSALLEKAYAKIHGSYETLKGGVSSEAMEDFTGGISEVYEIRSPPPNLYQILLKGYERASLMGCSIVAGPVIEAETNEGLITGHAYSITRVRKVQLQNSQPCETEIELLRLRNPWGNSKEWRGPWSDGSPEWRFVSDSEKRELGLIFQSDGEFWISFKDFIKYFSRIEVCNLNPDSLTDAELIEGNKKRWEMSVFEGKWVPGITAGGCKNFINTFGHNPQYRIILSEEDDDGDHLCTMIVALMQKNRSQNRNINFRIIGYTIFHLPRPQNVPKPLDMKFFKYTVSTAKSPAFINLREVTGRHKFVPGTYCIIPSTFEPNQEAEFLLRVFTEKPNIMEENEEKIGYTKQAVKTQPQKLKEVLRDIPEEEYEEEPEEEPKTNLTTKTKEIPEVESVEHSREGSMEEYEEVPVTIPLSLSMQEIEETEHAYKSFMVMVGEHGEIDWLGLKKILDSSIQLDLHISEFSKDICRSLVAMLDKDYSGRLCFKEFKKLWELLQHWKRAWIKHDIDNSGTFSGYELREALTDAGYWLNNRVLNILMQRFGDRSGEISFEDFILCVIKLKTMMDTFNERTESEVNFATFSLEEFLEFSLYS